MIPRRVFEAIKERDGGFCLAVLPGCGGEGTLAHHRANRGAGGSKLLDHPGNLSLLCGSCNLASEDAHAITRMDLIDRGLRVEKAATNAATLARVLQTPVTDLEGRRWLLIDEHTRQEVD